MTLIITALAALIATVIYVQNPPAARKHQIGALALIYVGAALMWCVDGFAAVAEGEPFVDLSDAATMTDDALLGICVVSLGLLTWGAIRLVSMKREREAA